jgi:hypothetical protein
VKAKMTALLPLAAPLSCLAAMLTYRPSADGAIEPYVRLGAFCCGAGLVGYAAARARWPALWPVSVAALLLAPLLFVGLHAVRLGHPARRGAPFVQVRDAFEGTDVDAAHWEISARPPAAVRTDGGALRVEALPGLLASAELRIGQPAWWTSPPASWFLPVGFDSGRSVEELAWSAVIARQHLYLQMVESERLLVQIESSGIRLTHRARGRSDRVELVTWDATGVAPDLQESARVWRLSRGHGELQLFLGGRSLWRAPETAPLGWIRFGETRADQEHGGVLLIDEVSYRRWWQAP